MAKLRIKVFLSDGGTFELFEYVAESGGHIRLLKYSFHWQDTQKKLRRRWDKAPHHPSLPNSPNHIHYEDGVVRGVIDVPDVFFIIRKIEEALTSYFMFSYIPAPLTIYKNINKLLPGHFLIVKKGKVMLKEYWDLFFEPDMKKKEGAFINEFMELLEESVRLRLMSDVPLGAFLSGGIDSSVVVALMSDEDNMPVNTFTIGFGGNTGGFDDERKYARLVAERYKTNHREHEALPDVQGVIFL